MYYFIFNKQPKAYNAWRRLNATQKDSYKSVILSSFNKSYPEHSVVTDDLYGIIYYFFKKNSGSDADNLSKPVWDCLSGSLFEDDNQVKLRTAGCFDVSMNDFNILNLTGLPGDVIVNLLDSFDKEDHFVYIECGLIKYNMFKFNITADGD